MDRMARSKALRHKTRLAPLENGVSLALVSSSVEPPSPAVRCERREPIPAVNTSGRDNFVARGAPHNDTTPVW
jgi:hypothetical protein